MREQTVDPGLGEKYTGRTKRLINKDGTFNITKRGGHFSIHDTFQFLAGMKTWKLMLTLIVLYLLLNVVFALLYLWSGIENLHRTDPELSPFLNAFFFSVQTFTTVGYGVLAPQGHVTNLLATLESMLGWIGFAIMTGLIYRRFSQPRARILYSNTAIITPYGEGMSLQFRVANMRSNVLMEMKAKVLLMLHEPETFNRRYFELKLERSSVQFFPLNWTIVHPIEESSPLHQVTQEEFVQKEGEILILISGYDDTFGQQIHSRFSYRFHEIEWGVRFQMAYEVNEQGETILNLHRLHSTEPVIPAT
ncbi:ion channel [Pontibacter ruber]|uniref:Ion channel n=1 Tax=Pontibacter ruber TaxID=1343895 RepID=A0ABW5CZT7_9BACT|nr:ion channel [Pontibacter ruber]